MIYYPVNIYIEHYILIIQILKMMIIIKCLLESFTPF